MRLILQTADVVCNAKNCLYPNTVEVGSAKELQEAVSFDHVCAVYRKNYRSISNFQNSNVLVMDCDNDNSDHPADWITLEKLEEIFEEISYAAAPSRHHMIAKDGKAARPKFHVYFEIKETVDVDYYVKLKRAVQKKYLFFDDNALDAARFIFGADSGEAIWHEGWSTIDEEVTVVDEEDSEDTGRCGSAIIQGSRNKTLSHFAGKALKRFGDTGKAHQIFLEEAAKCDPTLEDSELKTIWYSALKFFRNQIKG